MGKTKLYVVRHGQSEYNRDDLLSGHANPDLTELGREQAHATRERLKDVSFDVIYSSDLQRAIDTAAIVAGREVPHENRHRTLRERHFGSIDGLPGHHLRSLREQHRERFEGLSQHERWRYKLLPDMESDHELATRFIEGLIRIADMHPAKTILVGAHGAAIRTSLIELGYASHDQLPSGAVENAAYAVLVYDDGRITVEDTFGVSLLSPALTAE
jgi:uncharacterized phosphatase